jgi:hypothetical protein
MQREPDRAIAALMGENAGDPGEDTFGRIVGNAIRNGRLTAAEIRELRALIAAAFELEPLADEPAPRDIEWREPAGAGRAPTVH